MRFAKSRQGYVLDVEKTRTGYGAYVPDLPGCVAGGRTLVQMLRLMDEAIDAHTRGMREDGLPVQRPRTKAELKRVGVLRGESRSR